MINRCRYSVGAFLGCFRSERLLVRLLLPRAIPGCPAIMDDGVSGIWYLVCAQAQSKIRVSVGIVLRRAERGPVPLRWRVSNPPDVSLICCPDVRRVLDLLGRA